VADPVDTTRLTYDRIARSYAERSGTPTPELRAFRGRFAALAHGPVADLGCGPGRDLGELRAAGLPAIGVDLSPGMLALAKEHGPVVRGDLRRPPLADGSLGGIWSSAALLHVPRAEVGATLDAWHRLLRPGGVLELSTSLGPDEGWEPVPYDPEVRRWFVHHEEAALLGLLQRSGFVIEGVEHRETHRRWLMVLARRP
jgi:SAM-dependent methyltransferase